MSGASWPRAPPLLARDRALERLDRLAVERVVLPDEHQRPRLGGQLEPAHVGQRDPGDDVSDGSEPRR
jgi:hypothetical protein